MFHVEHLWTGAIVFAEVVMADTAIVTKQQVQIKTLLSARAMPLGIAEQDIDEWIENRKLDELTFNGAYDLINYLTVLPVSRTQSQAHLPLTASSILTNKKRGTCELCNQDVPAGLGLYVFNGVWQTYHNSEDCSAVTEVHELVWNSAVIVHDLDVFISLLPRMPKTVPTDPELLELSRAEDAELPFDLALPLLPYQRAGVKYALKARRVLLCDSMGLGKSCQAIAIAYDTAMRKERTLIVVPPHLLPQWEKECKRFAPTLKVLTLRGRKRHAIRKSDVVLIGDSVINHWAIQLAGMFNTLIVDEAHSIKNEQSQRTRGVQYVANSIPEKGIVCLMSGTLTPNRPSEFLSALRIIGRLNPVFGNRRHFLHRYCDYQTVNGFPVISGAINTTELNTILRSTCMVRRNKDDVLKDLPLKRRAQVDIELSDADMRVYRKAEEDFLTWVYNTYGEQAWRNASKAEVLTRMNKLREILGVAKIKSVADHAKSLLAEDEQVVIFAYHRKVIEGLKELLKDYGVVVVAGGVTPEKKQENVDRFMSGEAKVFIGQYLSAGTGLNLTCASHVILAETAWSPAHGQQAEDRCHRYGTTKPTVAWWITATDTNAPTIDMRMWTVLNHKAEVTSATLDGWAESLNADASSMSALLLKEMLDDFK